MCNHSFPLQVINVSNYTALALFKLKLSLLMFGNSSDFHQNHQNFHENKYRCRFRILLRGQTVVFSWCERQNYSEIMPFSELTRVFYLFKYLPSPTSLNKSTLLLIIYQKYQRHHSLPYNIISVLLWRYMVKNTVIFQFAVHCQNLCRAVGYKYGDMNYVFMIRPKKSWLCLRQ